MATMRPGAYLARRRAAAGFTTPEELARRMGVSTLAIRRASEFEFAQLGARLRLAETDRQPLAPNQIRLVARFVPFAPDIYEQLVVLDRAARHGWRFAHGNIEPQLCRVCACSWHDACVTDAGACAWAEADLCTACAPAEFDPLLVHLAASRAAQRGSVAA